MMKAINGGIKTQDEFTPEEREKIQQLRERFDGQLKDEMNEDHNLVKWLIARSFDLDKAEDMLKKHLRFKKVNGLDNILSDYTPGEAFDYFYTAKLGYDKEGSVVRLLNVGASDLRGLCMSLSKLDCIKHATYLLVKDQLEQHEDRKNDKCCDKQVYILDLQGLAWRGIIQRLVVERAYMLLRCYEANHPERLKVAYIVNVPSFFSFIYSWLKTVLPETIISKLEVLTQEECQSKLSQYIDPEILPAYLGGTRKDPDGDEKCPSLFTKPLGTPVPEKYLPVDHLEVLKNDPEARKTVVDYKSIFIAEKLVTVPNSTLMWDFQTTDYDIRMGLRYKPDEENATVEEIIPLHRVESHIIPENGNFMCEKPGIYELVFDNSYSWMTSKELYFKIKLEPPTDDIK